jgi:transcriptional regulator with XRE-family HTH domain
VIVGCLVKVIHRTFAEMSTLTDLSKRLRQLRRRHGLTQEQFAEIAGISYKFFQQIESGRKKQIWLDTVERLASGFGLEAWQLLAPDEPPLTIVASAPKGGRTRQSGKTPRPVTKRIGRQLAVAEDSSVYGTKSVARKKRTEKRGRGKNKPAPGSKPKA